MESFLQEVAEAKLQPYIHKERDSVRDALRVAVALLTQNNPLYLPIETKSTTGTIFLSTMTDKRLHKTHTVSHKIANTGFISD